MDSKKIIYIEKIKYNLFCTGIIELSNATRIFENIIIFYSIAELNNNQEVSKKDKSNKYKL